MMERVRIFNTFYKQIGEESLETVHQKGYWHETFHCWFYYEEHGTPYVFLQKRAKTKKHHPNKIDVTVAGHLHADECMFDGVREIKEELGININSKDLLYLGKRIEVYEKDEFFDHEYQHVFLAHSPLSINEINLQKEEVECLIKTKLSDLISLFKNIVDSILAEYVFSSHNSGIISLSRDDFVYRQDNYYLKIFIIIDKSTRKESDLYI